MVIVPVHVRGLALGALSFVTGPGRRGYRLSDLETAYGLAERVAVAIERVLLWRESRQAEVAATVQGRAAPSVDGGSACGERASGRSRDTRRGGRARQAGARGRAGLGVHGAPAERAIQAIEAVSTAGVAGGGSARWPRWCPTWSSNSIGLFDPAMTGRSRGSPKVYDWIPLELPATSHPWLACPGPGPRDRFCGREPPGHSRGGCVLGRSGRRWGVPERLQFRGRVDARAPRPDCLGGPYGTRAFTKTCVAASADCVPSWNLLPLR